MPDLARVSLAAGLAKRAWASLPNSTRYEYSGRGSVTVILEGVRKRMNLDREALPPQPSSRGDGAGVTVTQTGGGKPVASLLSFEGARPVWSNALIARGLRILAGRNGSLSPLDYPHAAGGYIHELICVHLFSIPSHGAST